MKIYIKHYDIKQTFELPDKAKLGLVLQTLKGALIATGYSIENVDEAILDIDY